MNTLKVLYNGWIKYLLLGCIAFIYTSCSSSQYYTYYDGIYEEPVHVPNTVFSEEMNRVNGLSNIEINEPNNYQIISQHSDINPNASYQNYINTGSASNNNSNPNVNIYVDNNIDPYWNNGWNDPYWSMNNRWNRYSWNSYGWNNFYWGSKRDSNHFL
ncbi:hypothetical protein [Wenyingzhuangia marina]|uniref:Uncharacterized protein n=1 Tax=Wenyingzhuangia marina TaxID=1195760 RepID=A0A1M5X208_9FLAO|nr:hypothetical protein [Wenyingzhuangia marina]SHH93849.1 hypothetical protein SAMN05444281_2831 [Wenyingzhuangia marina]